MDLVSEFMKCGPILQIPCGQKGIVPLAKKLTPENFPLKKDILEAVKDGLLKMVVFPKGVEEKIPSSLPFLLTPVQNRIGAYVFIDNIKSYNEKENTYSADPKKLYCLLESAYLAIIFQKNQTVISRSSVACSEGGSIYANMFITFLASFSSFLFCI